jgi:two-component sensor histidine kinase
VVERNTTERRQAERRQQLLLAELNHRVKNTLASVLSIEASTRQSSDTLDSFGRSFEGRVQSLASAHELLAENIWAGIDLRQLLVEELKPYHEGKDPPVFSGGEVFLPPRAALVLAMVFHELSTNAAKFGALSGPGGSIKVGWRIVKASGAGLLRLAWSERGGPRTEKPASEGFGLSFVKRSIAYELHGTAEMLFKPGGLQCRIEVPMIELRRDPELTPD